MSHVVNRKQCPSCLDKTGDNLIVYANGSEHCFCCGFHISGSGDKLVSGNDIQPARYKVPLKEERAPEEIPHRKIKLPTAEKYGAFRGIDRGVPCTVIPLGRFAQKIIRDDKEFIIAGDMKQAIPMGSDSFKDKSLPLIITEGEYDCLAVAAMVPDTYNCTSLVNGSNSVPRFIDSYRDLLSGASEIILFFDSDEPGRKAVEEFTKGWGYSKVRVVTAPVKDANEMLMNGMGDQILQVVKKAKGITPDGIVKISDMDDSLLDETQPEAIPSQYTALDYYLGGGFRRGELTMLTGGSGLGKSTFCTNLVYNLVMSDKKLKIADIKLEKRQAKNIKSYIAMYYNMSYRRICENPWLVTEQQREEFKGVFGNVYTNGHFGSLASGNLLSLLEYYAIDCKVDFIILDHISIAISGTASSREGERKDIDMLVTKIREIINKTNVAVICVSQLKNPEYDSSGYSKNWEDGKRVSRSHLRGSGSLQHLADNIISVEGNLYDPITRDERLIRLIKSREGDEQEVECDTFMIDRITQRAFLKVKEIK